MISRLKVSWMHFTGTVFMTNVTLTDGATRPIQLNSVTFKAVADVRLAPTRSSSGMVGAISENDRRHPWARR